jgi:hypothetical protein
VLKLSILDKYHLKCYIRGGTGGIIGMHHINNMTYNEFVLLLMLKKIKVTIDSRIALQIVTDTAILPNCQRLVLQFAAWIGLLCFPIAICLFIWVNWWSAILAIFFGLSIQGGVRRTACDFVIDAAKRDIDFFNLLVKLESLQIEEEE